MHSESALEKKKEYQTRTFATRFFTKTRHVSVFITRNRLRDEIFRGLRKYIFTYQRRAKGE